MHLAPGSLRMAGFTRFYFEPGAVDHDEAFATPFAYWEGVDAELLGEQRDSRSRSPPESPARSGVGSQRVLGSPPADGGVPHRRVVLTGLLVLAALLAAAILFNVLRTVFFAVTVAYLLAGVHRRLVEWGLISEVLNLLAPHGDLQTQLGDEFPSGVHDAGAEPDDGAVDGSGDESPDPA